MRPIIQAEDKLNEERRVLPSMKKTIAVLLLSFAFAPSLVFAQGSANPPNCTNLAQRRVKFLTTLLDLTASEQEQATTIFTNACTADVTVRASMKTARQSLNTAVQNNDTNGINAAAGQIGTLTGQLVANNALAEAAFYLILTPEQQSKLTAYRSQGHDRFGFGGAPGGFRGGPH